MNGHLNYDQMETIEYEAILICSKSISSRNGFKRNNNGLCSIYAAMFIIISLAVSLPKPINGQLMTCPQVCSCIWRNGKQTTICENQNLISIPNQISPSTQVLDLNNNNFQILPSKAFQERGLINLQKLFLPHCKLGVIADDAFHQLTNLVELDLSANLLTHVPVKALANATNLRRLLLNNNHIATIQAESFSALSNLKFLNLSGCKTHTIEPRAFYGLRDLEYLYLHDNHLTTLPFAVVTDLPALYSFELYRNPWQCNCEMRPTREWMVHNNVGQSIPPTCESPARLYGLMWNSLDLDDFACEPDIISTTPEVTKMIGSNATLSCVVKGLPEPKVYWYMDHGYFNISSQHHHPHRSQKYQVTEERTEGTVTSYLTIVGIDSSDDGSSFLCQAENRAGIKNKNFTIFALPSGAFSISTNWTRSEIAGIILGSSLFFVLCFIILILMMLYCKKFYCANGDAENSKGEKSHQDSSNDSLEKKKSLSKLLFFSNNNNQQHSTGNNSSGIYSTQQQQNNHLLIGQHGLSMLGLDGIDKKPEIFLKSPTNYQHPDLLASQQQQQSNSTAPNQQMPTNLPHLLSTAPITNNNSAAGVLYELNHFGHVNHFNHPINTLAPSSALVFSNDVLNGHQDTTLFNSTNDNHNDPQSSEEVVSGLYRAVMVPPSVITNNSSNSTNTMMTSISNSSSAPQTNSSIMTTTSSTMPMANINSNVLPNQRSSPPQYLLSAHNLYNQYLSQYDLSHAATSNPTPPIQQQPFYQTTSNNMAHHPSTMANGSSSPSPPIMGTNHPHMVYGNPGFISDNGFPVMANPAMLSNSNTSQMFADNNIGDDDVFVHHHRPNGLQQPLVTTTTMAVTATPPPLPPPTLPRPTQSNNNQLNVMLNEPIYGMRRPPIPTPVNTHNMVHTPTPFLHQITPTNQSIYGMTLNNKNRIGAMTPNPLPLHANQQQQYHHQQRTLSTANLMSTTSLSNIRYSPDEGYAEESGSNSNGPTTVGHLEGTEV